MIGHIIAEDRFLHQGIDHHLFVVRGEENENEFRFEVRCIQPGKTEQETIYERTIDFTDLLAECPANNVVELISAELASIRLKVFADEAPHANDP